MNPYRFLMPRLDGGRIEKDFKRYSGLVERGVAGFIIFGGELRRVREGIKKLQAEAARHWDGPLIIASDLEQGLGQQIKGGTLFPPAMALLNLKQSVLRRVFGVMAEEAAYAGINTILAPVLDINTDPDNPIIGTRSFGEDPETVSTLGVEMIKIIQKGGGMASCGKHFPGHGDTAVDSHIGLPTIRKPLKELQACELIPFKKAIAAGVKTIMLGHLSVPALDPSGMPVSLSRRAVGFIRNNMGFKGILMTDAMNMGALGKFGRGEAATMALRAGVDIILHPDEPEKTASAVEKTGIDFPSKRLLSFRKTLPNLSDRPPTFDKSFPLEVARKVLRVEGALKPLDDPVLVLLADDKGLKTARFIAGLKIKYPGIKVFEGRGARIPGDRDIIVAAFSRIKAWKGGAAPWIKEEMRRFDRRAKLFISFGSPYLIKGVRGTKVYAWWDSEYAQTAAASLLASVE